jgi:hypothetical protein
MDQRGKIPDRQKKIPVGARFLPEYEKGRFASVFQV